MRTPHVRVRGGLSCGLLALALAGCTAMGAKPSSPSAASSSVVTLTAALGGANEVPPNTRSGTGQAEAQFNRDTGELKWTVSYSGLSGPATMAHIHGPAAPTANAPVVVPFSNVGQSPITGTAKLTPAQAGDLLAGLYYVNIHTAAHPPGELRGQLMQKR